MRRAKKACSHPTCSQTQPCPTHQREPWQGGSPRASRRRRSGLTGWQEQKRNKWVLRRFGGICHVCGQPGADQVDHVDHEGGDDLDNLRPIHAEPCHRGKTAREATEARQRGGPR